MDSWSKHIFRRNVSKTGRKYQTFSKKKKKKLKGNNFILDSAGTSLANSLVTDFCWSFLCFGGGFSYPGHSLMHFKLRYVRSMHIAGCVLQFTIIKRCYNAALIFPIVTFPVTLSVFWIESVLVITIYHHVYLGKNLFVFSIRFTINKLSLNYKMI